MSGTSGVRMHISSVHNLDPNTGELQSTSSKVARRSAYFELVDKKELDWFKMLLIRWFILCQLAPFMLENVLFRDFVAYPNTSLLCNGW